MRSSYLANLTRWPRLCMLVLCVIFVGLSGSTRVWATTPTVPLAGDGPEGTLVREGGLSALVVEAPSRQVTLAQNSQETSGTSEASRALQRAREAAAADRHLAAISSYRRAFELDANLLPQFAHELGHQYTWADQPAEAIGWYQMRISVAPEDRDAQLGLARALAWSDRTEAAANVYKEWLQEHPDDLEAQRGHAQMLMWQDQNRAAIDAWQRILREHPNDPQARLGLAQATNWAGFHRDAARQFEVILEEDPGNESAAEGLVDALRWSGQPGLALQRMRDEGMGPNSAQLYRELSRESRSSVDLGYTLSDDSDELRTDHFLVRWEQAPSLPNSWQFSLQRRDYEQPGQPDAQAYTVVLGGRRQLNAQWRANIYAQLHQLRSDSPINGVSSTSDLDWIFPGFDAWFTWQRSSRLRFDFSTDRNFLATHRSLGNEIAATSAGLSSDLQLSPWLQLNGMVKGRHFSDGNRRIEGRAGLLAAREGIINFAVGPSWYGFHSLENVDSGYWNPRDFMSLGVDLRLRWDDGWRPIYVAADLRGAREEADGDTYGVFGFSGRVGWRIGLRADLELAGGSSDSRLSSSGGYERNWGQLLLRLHY